jgi:hypothetical protein
MRPQLVALFAFCRLQTSGGFRIRASAIIGRLTKSMIMQNSGDPSFDYGVLEQAKRTPFGGQSGCAEFAVIWKDNQVHQ